MHYPV